jgi:hypothetical protein
MADAAPQESLSIPSIRMVIQRYRFASMLVEENHVVSVGQKCSSLIVNETAPISSASLGLLAYISFSISATEEKVVQASKTLLNMPVGTLGAWGDGSGVQSMLQLLSSFSAVDSNKKETEVSSPLSIVLVPQANLIAKIKKNGKSIQYRDQIAKEKGKRLYDLFCDTVQTLLMDHEAVCRGQKSEKSTKNSDNNKSSIPDPDIPPDQLFRRRSLEFATFDDDKGLPLTMINGDPVTKSARKRMQKQYDAHAKRHEKYLQKQQANTDPTPPPKDIYGPTKEAEVVPARQLDPSFIQLITGTFGKRQGLEIQSDMGPFCHVVEI